MKLPTCLCLVALALQLSLSPAQAQPLVGISAHELVGISAHELKNVKELNVSEKRRGIDQRAAMRLLDATESKFAGAKASATRIGFDFNADGGEAISVKGVVYSLGLLRAEHYRVKNRDEALALATHSNDKPDEFRILEVRGRDVLILSGEALKDRALAERVRSKAWSRTRGMTPPSMLSVEDSGAAGIWYAGSALNNPTVKRVLKESFRTARLVGGFDPDAITTQRGPDSVRVEADGSILDFHVEGDQASVFVSPTLSAERRVKSAIGALVEKSPNHQTSVADAFWANSTPTVRPPLSSAADDESWRPGARPVRPPSRGITGSLQR